MTRSGSRLAVAAVTTMAALTALGCGGDDDGGGDAGSASGQAIRLEATEFEFEPAEVTIAPGQHAFEIVNRGRVEHALEIHAPDGEVETDRVGPDESASVTADMSEPGSYELYCPVGNHRQLGMEGTVKVAADGEEPAPEPEGGDGGAGGGSGY